MKRVSLLVPLVSLLVIAGCGSSKSSSSASGTSSSTQSSSTSAGATSKASGGAAPSGGAASSGGAAPSGGAIQVSIKSLAFNPGSVHAKVGDTVKWTNNDGPPHNVTWTGGPKFTSSKTLNTNATFTLKLTQAGTIHYFCSIHPFMKATIVVAK